MESTYDLAARGAAQEEGRLGVLDGLGRPLLERALGAGIPGFSVWVEGQMLGSQWAGLELWVEMAYTWRSIVSGNCRNAFEGWRCTGFLSRRSMAAMRCLVEKIRTRALLSIRKS